ncbi:MAG: FAD:protein FMN transferase [Actinobacteria bacterium]|nr:FAD:protein FMN transferase [Actinomycetota bacterium]
MEPVLSDEIPFEDDFVFTASGDCEHQHVATFQAFNTVVLLQAYGEEDVARSAFLAARDACRVYERLFSRTLPNSDISRINSACGASVGIAESTYRLLEKSIRYCALSQGTFDITIGSVTRLWNFHQGVIPSDEALEVATSHVDYRVIELSGELGDRKALLLDVAAAVDLGGTAKGYIADELKLLMRREGLGHFLINLGGNVVVSGGKPDGSAFNIGIKDPQDTQKILGAIPLIDGSVVTSGLYERAFTLNGRRYSHILDTKTGLPIHTDAESVTVVAPYSVDCDGFSTTLCALGIEKGLEFARSRQELSLVIFVDSDNRLHSSRD